MTERIFTPMAGGLGDILSYYLDGELGHFAAAKAAGYETAVKVFAVNNQSPDLFRFNPHVDHVLSEPFGPALVGMTEDFRPWAAAGEPTFRLMTDDERNEAFWYEKPRFHLSPEEADVARDIEAGGPYVAVHPFAGAPARSLAKHHLARTVVAEAAKYGRAVILGGDSNRNNGRVSTRLVEHYEPYDINEISVVGLYSVRLHAHLASKAKAFIGTVSAYNCVAHSCNIPALLFGSPDNRRSMQQGAGAVFAKMREQGTAIHYLDTAINYPKVIGDFCEKHFR